MFTRKLNVSAAKKTDSEESLSSSHDSGADSLEDTTQTAIKNLRHLLMVRQGSTFPEAQGHMPLDFAVCP